MHGVFIRNLKRATRYVFHGDRHRHASAGYEPKVYPAGRRARQETQRPAWLDFLFWTWPTPLLVVIGQFGGERSFWIHPFFGWSMVSVFALVLGISAPLSRPRHSTSYWILGLNLGAICFAYIALGLGNR